MYVDAIRDASKGLIKVVERDENGDRRFVEYPIDNVFYYSHGAGTYTSIYGDPCKRYANQDTRKFRNELNRIRSVVDRNGKPKHKIFEAELNPIFRCLADNYRGSPTPKLNIGFFDIETDFDADRGFAPVTDPFNPVTAISVYLTSCSRLVTLVLCPSSITLDEGLTIAETFQDTILFDNERDLLKTFLDVIEDVDVLSGWNSNLYDIPYLVNRITRILGSDATRALCLWGQKPFERSVLKFGKEHQSYDLSGRVHLDYLDLYQKHNTQQRHSYRLDYIGEMEVGENKVAYEGTLDDLYKKEFRKFIEYNRQDTLLLFKIDRKLKYLELSNQIAHSNFVRLKNTLGSVVVVEQAIINAMHDLGFVVPDGKPRDSKPQVRRAFEASFDDDDDAEDDRKPVVGAYVAQPKVGIHDHVAAIDINSLYPSVLRALNMSPETYVGQVRLDMTQAMLATRIASGTGRAEAWDGIFTTLEYDAIMARTSQPLTIDYEDGTSETLSARQLHDRIMKRANNLCVTANATIFSTAKEGIIPTLLARWYSERKGMQAQEKEFLSLETGLVLPADIAMQLRAIA